MQLRPKHLLWPIGLLVILESLIFYINSQEALEYEPASDRQPKERLHRHQKMGGRSPAAPRIAIVTLHSNHGQHPTNTKGYAHMHGYDFVDATRSVSAGLGALQAARADPSFIKIFAIIRFLPLYDWVR